LGAGAVEGEASIPLPTVTPTREGGVPEEAVAPGAAPPVTVTINAANGVNVRRDPDATVENTIRLLENGTILPVVARSEDGTWIQVLLPDGLTGWITSEFVEIAGDLESLPPPGETVTSTEPSIATGEVITSGVEPPPPYTSVIPGENAPAVILVVPDGVNARSAPSTDADVITVVPEGAVLPALARSTDSQWVQVELPTDELAWIFRETVTATPAVGALPAVETETPTPTPEPVTATEEAATDEAADEEAPVESVATASVRPLFLPVYAEPNSETESVARAPRGSALGVTGRNAAGDWIQVVSEDGTLGWVSANGVQVSVDVTTLPVVE
jgi:SH3-like domain-containing protein